MSIRCRVNRFDNLGRYVWGGRVVFGRRLDNRNSWQLRHSINELLPLSVAGSCRIDDDILGVARRSAEQIEDGDSVVGIRLAERVAVDVNLGDIRNDRKTSELSGIRQIVVPEVDPLQRQQPLDAS